jgi:2-C-methyl-D-erythritol 4-phosphate cytidylyltransferase
MGTQVPKQFLTLGGVPLLVHSLRVLDAAEWVHDIILAVPEADRESCLRDIVTPHGFKKVRQIVAGGAERQDSVRHALEAIEGGADLVLVHDAVRPFLTVEMVARVLERAAAVGAAIVAIPMRDTVKRVSPDRLIEDTVERHGLWLAQTPQAFRTGLLREAHQKALAEGKRATDDAQLIEWLGHPVGIVEGNTENIKITRPEDLGIGEAILAARGKR